MIICFELTMPNVGSWNGKWTGATKRYFIFKTLQKSKISRLMQNNETRNFYYNFGDGWGANVKLTQISSKEKQKLNKINAGFMGYDWMVDSIIENDKIVS